MDISDAARAVCGQYFPTADSRIRSSPPHEALGRMRAAIDELVGAGLVSETPFNAHGVVEIKGSERAAEISQEHRRTVLVRSLFPEADDGRRAGPGL